MKMTFPNIVIYNIPSYLCALTLVFFWGPFGLPLLDLGSFTIKPSSESGVKGEAGGMHRVGDI